MGDEELLSFISKSRAKGRSDEQIIRALLSVGWKKDRIDAAFSSIDGQKAQGPNTQETEWQPQPSSQLQAQAGVASTPAKKLPQDSVPKKMPQAAPPQKKDAPSASEEEEHGVKMPPVLPPVWPADKAGQEPDLPTTQYKKVAAEEDVKNPAFSHVGASSTQSHANKLLTIIAILLILALGFSAYYFLFHLPSEQAKQSYSGQEQQQLSPPPQQQDSSLQATAQPEVVPPSSPETVLEQQPEAPPPPPQETAATAQEQPQENPPPPAPPSQ